MPSILFVNRVYPPDDGATGQLLAELAEALARAGWRVTVLTSGKGVEDRTWATAHRPAKSGTVTVERVRGLPFTRASLARRALSYASLYPALFWRALRLPSHDVMVTLTDPPLLMVLGPWLKLWKRSRLLHWAQDVYPEVAEELGVLRKNGLTARCLRALSTAALRRHDHVIVVGRCMKERLQARGLDASKIVVIPNWAVGAPAPSSDSSPLSPNLALSIPPVARDSVEPCSAQSSEFRVPGSKFNSDRSQHPFTVMYSGNFGLAHPFEAIIHAVKILDEVTSPGSVSFSAVRFVFAGAGPKLSFVRERLTDCTNVEFREPAALENLPASLAAADVHLACMSDALLGLVVPSKIYGALAAGRPCLFLGPRDSEAARLILESKRGLVFDPQSGGPELAAVLARWAQGDAEFAACRAACAEAASHISGVPLSDFLHVFAPTTPRG